MKLAVKLIIIILPSLSSAQNWSNWVDVGKGVQISFKFGARPCEGLNNTYARIRNTSEVKYSRIRVEFDKNCGEGTASVSAYNIGSGEINESPGNFYTTALKVSHVRLTHLEDGNHRSLLGNVGAGGTGSGGGNDNGQLVAQKREEQGIVASNTALKQKIRFLLNVMPAGERQNQLFSEFNGIVSKYSDNSSQLTTELEVFKGKIDREKAKIEQDEKQFTQNREDRLQQISDLKSGADGINQQQSQIAAGLVAAGVGLAVLKTPEGEQFKYRGGSYKIELKGGLHSIMMPVGVSQTTSGSIFSNGRISSVNKKEFIVESLWAPGLYAESQLSPYNGDHLSISFVAGASYNYFPSTYEPDLSGAGADMVSNAYKSVWDYNYGGELAIGGESIKLLTKIFFETRAVYSSSIISSTFSGAGYNSESETWHKEDQNWTNQWVSLGLRLGNQAQQHPHLDISMIRTRSVKINGMNTPYKFKDLFGGLKDTPMGLSVQFSQQSGWSGKLLLLKNFYIVDLERKLIDEANRKVFFELSVGKSIGLYGKPY